MDIYDKLLPFRRRTMAPGADRLLRTVLGYGITLSGVGRHAEAIPLHEEAAKRLSASASAQILEARADLALARARYAHAGGPALSDAELTDLRRTLAEWVDSAAVDLGPRDTGTTLARARLAELDSLVGAPRRCDPNPTTRRPL